MRRMRRGRCWNAGVRWECTPQRCRYSSQCLNLANGYLSGSGELADMGFSAQTFTVAVTGFGVQASNAKLATMEDKLPNPYALTITSGSNSVTYDGHAPKSIDIPVGCNANLLRNATFADGCIVNQRGKTSYAGTGYGVDMWYTTGATLSVDVTAEGRCTRTPPPPTLHGRRHWKRTRRSGRR